MRMIRPIPGLFLALGITVTLPCCNEEASDEEIQKMCDRLAVLRGNENDDATKRQCRLDARKDRVSRRQARCRIFAVNTQEYWNRCRTGEAR